MTGWAAIVPIKAAAERKSRLRGMLGDAARIALTERLMEHVVETLRAADSIGEVAILAPAPPAGWSGPWIADRGRGLNAELAAARGMYRGRAVMIVHADLPDLSAADVRALAAAARGGIAIAPDRRGTGTNAVAMMPGQDLRFAFGPGSFALHVAAAGRRGSVVRRPGLGFDVDTPDDLAHARAAGLVAELPRATATLP